VSNCQSQWRNDNEYLVFCDGKLEKKKNLPTLKGIKVVGEGGVDRMIILNLALQK